MKKLSVLISMMLILFLGSVNAAGQSANDLFQKALAKEQVEGDLEGAIALYQKVVSSAQDESLAANAQLRIGNCYEKLGNAMAVKAYEAVLNRFPKQTEAVAEARDRLASLRQENQGEAGITMTRLLPTDIYLENQRLSPDGTKVAGIEFDKGQNVVVYDLAKNKMDFVTEYDWSAKARWTYVPVWSPESRRIVFLSAAGKDDPELWISDLSRQPRLLYKNPNGTLAPCDWLPDGSAVLAVVEGENSSSKLGFISVKEGSLNEICFLTRPFRKDRDPELSEQGGSADISPDGKYIAFSDATSEGNGDLYCISIDGRTKTVLIDHPANDMQPRWSPDGRHIVFLSDRHGSLALWSLAVSEGKAVGTPSMLLEGMQDSELASWTTAGLQTISFISMAEVDILEIDPISHIAADKPHILDLAPNGSYGGFRWSPDGRYLFIASYQSDGRKFVFIPSEDGQPRYLPSWPVPVSSLKGGSAAWLPDSSGIGIIYWQKEDQLHFGKLNLGTGEWEIRAVPATGFGFKGFHSNINSIVWSADNGKLSFFYLRSDGAEPLIIARELDTGSEHTLCRLEPSQEFGWSLKASNDRRLLTLHDDGDLLVANTETGQVQRFEFGDKGGLFLPSLSPDGKFLVAKGDPETGGEGSELYILSLADGQLHSLDINKHMIKGSHIQAAPDWSPDGRKIAFDARTFLNETNLIRGVIPKK